MAAMIYADILQVMDLPLLTSVVYNRRARVVCGGCARAINNNKENVCLVRTWL